MADIARRIRAAQALGGFESIQQLANAAALPKFSKKTIDRILYGQRRLEEHERNRLAEIAGVTPDFFTVDDLTTLSVQPTDDSLSDAIRALGQQIGQQIHQHDRDTREAVANIMGELRAYQNRIQLEERLNRIEDVLEARGDEFALRDAGRAISGSLADRLGDAAEDDEAAASTHANEDANQASAQARREGTQSS
jgi:transcriptional regulator with XRE-family HTH domain